MLSELLEKLGDLFSDGGSDYHYDGQDAVMNGMDYSGIDLSMYSPDEIEEALKAALEADGGTTDHILNYGHDISFGAASDVDARNLAKSSLLDKLGSNHIYTSSLSTDDYWGGLDTYSGDKVYDAINDARDDGRISDSVYKELMSLLKKACHTQ